MKELKLAKDLLVQVVDNEAVIVSPEQGMITSVNETGAFLVMYIQENNGADKDELVDALAREYNGGKEDFEKDITAFIEEMKNQKILE